MRETFLSECRLPAGMLAIALLAVTGCSPSSERAADSAAIDRSSAGEPAGGRSGAPVVDSAAPAPRTTAPTQPSPVPETPAQRRSDGSPRNPPIHRTTPRDDDVLNPPPRTAPSTPPGDLMAQVLALAKTTGCATAGDCRTLPVGRKACGGPRAYVVYCPASTDERALQGRIDEVTRADMEASRGAVSDCMLVTEPTVTLSGGRCTAGGAPR